MKKLLGIIFALCLLAVVLVEAQAVAADKGDHTKPVTAPVTSPTTCKPGFGFGDKNHCHVKQDKDDKGKRDNDTGKNSKSDKDDHNNQGHR